MLCYVVFVCAVVHLCTYIMCVCKCMCLCVYILVYMCVCVRTFMHCAAQCMNVVGQVWQCGQFCYAYVYRCCVMWCLCVQLYIYAHILCVFVSVCVCVCIS